MEITLASVGVLVATQIVKKYVSPKWGATGVHVFAFLVGLAIVCVKGLVTAYPSYGEMVTTAGTYLVGALALYEVIFKQLNARFNFGL